MKKSISIALAVLVCLSLCVFGAGCKRVNGKRTTYQIECSLEGNILTGKQKLTFYNNTDNTFNELKFNLYGNAFRKGAKYSPVSAQHQAQAYPNGVSYGDMQIKRVSSCGTELSFSVCGEDENVLSVALEREVFPQEVYELDIDYTLTLADVVARTGINKNTINLANFYPVLCGIQDGSFYECLYYSAGDPFFSDCADYTVTLTCNAGYVVASSGQIESAVTSGEKTTNTYKIENARSFAFVLSQRFDILTQTVGGTQINYYYYADANPKASLQTAVLALEYFNATFGEYVYPTYSVVETEFVQGGMEFPALVMIGSGLEEPAYKEVIVHETAHQWWQTAVGNNEVEYGFLDEGLAEYSVVLFYENHKAYGLDRQTLVKSAEQTYKIFCSVQDKVFGKVNTVMLRSLGEFSGEYEYVNMAYIKPCIMYDYLRQTVGEERFFKGLRRYYEQFKFTNANPYGIVGVYEKLGADTNGYFEGFYQGKAII